jgi:hypothetical protein
MIDELLLLTRRTCIRCGCTLMHVWICLPGRSRSQPLENFFEFRDFEIVQPHLREAASEDLRVHTNSRREGSVVGGCEEHTTASRCAGDHATRHAVHRSVGAKPKLRRKTADQRRDRGASAMRTTQKTPCVCHERMSNLVIVCRSTDRCGSIDGASHRIALHRWRSLAARVERANPATAERRATRSNMRDTRLHVALACTIPDVHSRVDSDGVDEWSSRDRG